MACDDFLDYSKAMQSVLSEGSGTEICLWLSISTTTGCIKILSIYRERVEDLQKKSESRKILKKHICIISGEALLHVQMIEVLTHSKKNGAIQFYNLHFSNKMTMLHIYRVTQIGLSHSVFSLLFKLFSLLVSSEYQHQILS